jgi:hypothetical protein
VIVYLAHPVAPTPEQLQRFARSPFFPSADLSEVAVNANLASARRWLRFLVLNTDWAISAPWMPYVEALGEDGGAMRERGLRDDCMMAARCDAIALTGGRISSGMARERDAAMRVGRAVIDLTDLGSSPPVWEARDMLATRLRAACGIRHALERMG